MIHKEKINSLHKIITKTEQNLMLIIEPQRELCLILKRKQHSRFSLPLTQTKMSLQIDTENEIAIGNEMQKRIGNQRQKMN